MGNDLPYVREYNLAGMSSRHNGDLLVGVCLILLALSQLSLVACKSQPSSGNEVAPLQEKSAEPTPDSVELQDVVITPSHARRTLGKHFRPECIIEGQIKNNSPSDITAVTIRVSIRKENTEVDRRDFHVESLVPGGEARSFTQQIQVTPPKSGMHWTYEVVEVETDTAAKQRGQNPN